MADFITDESVVTPVKSPLDIKTFYNQSVIFEFNGGIDPIACDIEYLYAENIEPMENYIKVLNSNINGLPLDIFGENNGIDTVTIRKRYKFIDIINYLIFKYGLKHEYYKNIFGQWINVTAIRSLFSEKTSSDIIINNWFVGEVNNDYIETSIYKKICDLPQFNGSNVDNLMGRFFLKDINMLPACKYIIKIPNSNNGKVAYINKADGTYKLEKIKKYNFRQINEVNEVITDDVIWFNYELADHNTGVIASGDFNNNNHHKFDDILLTFTDKDGNPYTDLNNLFITLNGMVVDYQIESPGSNKIFINNVIKYARYQIKGLKEGYTLDSNSEITEDNQGNHIVNYNLDFDKLGYVWTFDIIINKWEGVSISHFEDPISNKSLLKTEPTEDRRSFWLTTGMVFSNSIDKNKCLLICGNEIVSKDSWEVDKNNSHCVNLIGISAEFDIIYSEMYRRLRIYTETMIGHQINNAPKITDFLKDSYGSLEEVERAIEAYEVAVQQYIDDGGEYNYHYCTSAINIVKQQFINRQYSIIRFDTLDNLKYDVEVEENHLDLQFNTPMRDRMRNLNWSLDDIIIINGIQQQFVNEYDNVFKPVAKWYLPDIKNTLDDVNGYKLEVCKHYMSLNKYVKLNYTMLTRGPIEGRTYYEYNERLDHYIPLDNLTEFDKSYVKLSPTEISNGMERDIIYYTRSISNDNQITYNIVPSSFTEFEEGVTYYKLVFNKDYYILKK